MRIAGIQMHSTKDREKNLEKAAGLLEIAVNRGARIVCFPELFNAHWFPFDVNAANFDLAETMDGQTITRMREAAQKHGVTLICPIFEKGDEDKYYNTAVVIDNGGQIIGKYQKVHIPQIPYWEEKSYFSTGEEGFEVFRAEGADFGILICWDNFFPEAARILALKGAQIIFCPTAAAFASQSRWETAIKSNSLLNGLYSLRVNRVGRENKLLNFYGRSFCADPEGKLVDEPAGAQEGVFIVDVSMKEIKKTRKTWPFFKERKKELYSEILELDDENI